MLHTYVYVRDASPKWPGDDDDDDKRQPEQPTTDNGDTTHRPILGPFIFIILKTWVSHLLPHAHAPHTYIASRSRVNDSNENAQTQSHSHTIHQMERNWPCGIVCSFLLFGINVVVTVAEHKSNNRNGQRGSVFFVTDECSPFLLSFVVFIPRPPLYPRSVVLCFPAVSV